MKLMDFSELSSCGDLRDRVYSMIGLAFDCKNRQIMPDYTQSLMEVYSDVMLHILYHSSLKLWDRDRAWSYVHHSQLVQRALFGLSTSISERRCSLPDAKLDELTKRAKLEVKGLKHGTVIGTIELEPGDIWWTHPGFVKPILSEIAARQGTDTEECPSITKVEVGGAQSRGDICYAASNTIAGDLICRFIDSDIAAIIRMEDNKYILVGRAMILGVDQDMSIFTQGIQELPELKHLGIGEKRRGRGKTIYLTVTPDEPRELTSPCY
jgi:hypothetical protein